MEQPTATPICTRPRVAVCVLTYRRRAGLARALVALSEQRFGSETPELRVVVVDNDAEGSARPVVRGLDGRIDVEIEYHVEKRRGIPQARNAALAAALGWADFIAFLDDDEEPEKEWLAELLRAQREFTADAVTGPALSRFDAPPPEWILASGAFERPRYPTGSRRNSAVTGNVLIRAAALATLPEWFDERMALTGGEDSEFFQRFDRSGRRIVWCDTAVVHDAVPPACATLPWILARAYRAGAVEAYIAGKHAPGGWTTGRVLLHGGYCVARGAVMLAAAAFSGRGAAARALRLASFGVGLIGGVVGWQYAEYRHTHGS